MVISLLVTVFLLLPVHAKEIQSTTAWDAGYVKASVILPETTAQYDTGDTVGNGSCIAFVKWVKKVNEPWWNPYWVWNNHGDLGLKKTTLREGAIFISSEGTREIWHMGIVTSVGKDTFTVVEQNYLPYEIGTRTLPKDYAPIIGFLI